MFLFLFSEEEEREQKEEGEEKSNTPRPSCIPQSGLSAKPSLNTRLAKNLLAEV